MAPGQELNLRALSSEELASHARAGSEACFEELVRRHSGPLHGFLCRRVGNSHDAEDLVQETFLRARANLDRFEPRYAFSTWLFTIGSRLAARAPRGDEPREDAAADLVDEETPSRIIEGREERTNLWARGAGIVSDAEYETLWLMYGEGLTVAEIARRSGRSRVHVKVLLHRGRVRLARRLAKDERP